MNEVSSVVLPCSEKDFGSFVSELLGKPQTISKSIPGPFEIKAEDVNNIYHLLKQRVGEQNEATLTQFTAKLVFSDNSSVLLNKIDDFLSYNEVRPIVCNALHLSWTFLVKFNDKNYPEKQMIDLSFVGNSESEEDRSIIFDQDIPLTILSGISQNGFISYRISHTARTWGADIDSLLTGHLQGITDEIPKIRKWIAKHSEDIGKYVFCLLFLFSALGAFFATSSFLKTQKLEVLTLKNAANDSTLINHQISYLLDIAASGTWERFLFISVVFLLSSLALSFMIAIWIESTANNLPPSFLLLTKESEKRKIKILAKRKTRFRSFIASLIAALIQGIIVNICYALFFENLIK